MQFVAVLEPNERCKIGCSGSGILRRMPTRAGKVVRSVDGEEVMSVESICPCCKVTVLSKDPDEALKKLAELTGRSVRSSDGIVTPRQHLEDIKERHIPK